jgi:hypothetical protein
MAQQLYMFQGLLANVLTTTWQEIEMNDLPASTEVIDDQHPIPELLLKSMSNEFLMMLEG